jgi:type I restriction enzyme M protein
LSNAEQLSFLFFFYMIEGIDAANLRQAKATGRKYTSLFAGDWNLRNPLNAPAKGIDSVPRERMRWSSWANALSGEQLVTFVRDEVFPFFASIADAYGLSFMGQARLAIDEPTVLTQIVSLVNELRLEQADPDTKGDMFEHVLRQIKQAGELGQFRTPRHIIRAIVSLVDPKIGETVYDPAAGTAGFLVAAYEHVRLANSSPHGRELAEFEGKTFERGYGDRLNQAQWRKLQTATFYGNDVDPKMVSLASMNLALRGLPDVRILRRNVLTTSFDRQMKAEKSLPLDGYDVVLANPPFSGRIDRDRIVDDVKIGTTTATELLFVRYMRALVRQIYDGQPHGRWALRRDRARGRALRLDRRA